MRLTQRTLAQPDSPIGAHAHLLDDVPANKPLLDLSQGAPGFPPAPEVQQRMADIAAHPDGSRYGPLRGLLSLRTALVEELNEVYGGDVALDDVCITSGCNQAFAMVVSALTEPGDEVMLAVPYYFNHDMWLGLDGAVSTYLKPSNGLSPSTDDAAAVLTDRTRAIVLVTPGNPTGHTMSSNELGAFADFARDNDVALIIDETYRSFIPGDAAPHELFHQEAWREHVVSLHSFSKDLAIPGQRVGAVVGAPALLNEVAKLIDCVTICPSRIGQEGAHAGLTEAGEWRQARIDEIAAKQHRFEQIMAAEPGGFELLSAGAYYGWVRHPFADVPTSDIVEQLLLEQGILMIPGTAFMPADEQCIRFSFANAEIDRLDELTTRLSDFSLSRELSG